MRALAAPFHHRIATFGLAFLAMTMAAVSFAAFLSWRDHRDRISRAHAVALRASAVLASITDAETSQRGYLLTGKPQDLRPYVEAQLRLPAELARLRQAAAEDPEFARLAAAVAPLVASKRRELARTLELDEAVSHEVAAAFVQGGDGERSSDEIRRAATALVESAESVGTGGAEKERTAASMFLMLYLEGFLIVAVVALALSGTLTRYIEGERRAKREAEEANQAKSQFLAAMSHELRTPLNAILGYAELIGIGIYGPTTEAQLRGLERIRLSGRHLLTLIEDVLSFARVEAGRLDFRVADVPARELADTAAALVLPQLQAKGLRLQVVPAPDDLLVRADRDKVQQILLNLLTNACKFTASGGDIALAVEADERGVVFRVTDTGRGIPPERMEAIFEPFVQVESEDGGEARSGVGLGLAISRNLARGMGGDLRAQSTVGQGSTFTLRLPRAHAAAGTPHLAA